MVNCSPILCICTGCKYFELYGVGKDFTSHLSGGTAIHTCIMFYDLNIGFKLNGIQVLGHLKTILILVLGFTFFNVSIL